MRVRPTGEKWYKTAASGGEKWKHGKLHLEFMIKQGLCPQHRLLEVGCRPLRAGRFFIRYLNTANYCGFDNCLDFVEEDARLVKSLNLSKKLPTIWHTTDFDVAKVNRPVKFAWAYSVFTHLMPEQIERCLNSVRSVLTNHGAFFASCNLASTTDTGYKHGWRDEQHVTHYTKKDIKELAKEAGMSSQFVSDPFTPVYKNRKNKQTMWKFCPIK